MVKYFLDLLLANVDLIIVPINLWRCNTPVSNVRAFIKRFFFLLVRKLAMHGGLIICEF